MKRASSIVVLMLALPAFAEELTVGYQKTVQVQVPGAVAAYSLNSACAEARVEDETLLVRGKVPGTTSVVVVLKEGTRAYSVRVPEPPPSRPKGFEMPLPRGDSYGSYELRYASGPAQLQNVFNLTRQEGDRTLRLHVATANLFTGVPGRSRLSLPSAFFQIQTPRREITLGDQTIQSSMMTLNGSTVRGVHLRQGEVTLHAGYTSIAEFQDLFLPAVREGVLGVRLRRPLAESAALTFNVFHFSHRGRAGTVSSGTPGPVASLVYEYKPSDALELEAEAGLSHGRIGGSLLFRLRRADEQFFARLRYQPRGFASLAANNFHGFYSDVSWARQVTDKLKSSVRFTGNRYSIANYEQTNLHSQIEMRYQPTRNWSVLGGAAYARYQPQQPPRPGSESFSFPLGVGFDGHRFGTSFQYRFSRHSGSDLGGHQLRQTVRASWDRLHVSAFVDRQTQAPTVDVIFRELPGLAQAVTQLGLAATSPEELGRLLEENPALAGLGYVQGVNFHLSPVRLQAGGTVAWMGRGTSRQQLNYSFLFNNTQSVGGAYQSALHSWTYSRKLSASLDVFVSMSLLRSPLSTAGSGYQPLVAFSLRHHFNGVPRFLLPGRTGTISGVVFRDDDLGGELGADEHGLAGIEVVLDGVTVARTDRNGRYVFSRVTPGRHTVEVVPQRESESLFTTDSHVETDINTRVDFGVAAAPVSIVGLVHDDAGTAIARVAVAVSGDGNRRSVQTDGEGKFRLQGLQPGPYELAINTESVPPGYLLEGVRPVRVVAQAEEPAQVEFTLAAIRTVAGRITLYDPAAARVVPVRGVVVRLEPLGRESTSDSSGAFLFRALPPGEYTASIVYAGRSWVRTLIVPAGPFHRTDFNFDLSAN